MFTTVEQSKQIVEKYLGHSGRGGFMTGTVDSTAPLSVITESGYPISAEELYVTDNCIGLLLNLEHLHQYEDADAGKTEEKESEKALRNHVVLRRSLAPGDGVLLLCRPGQLDGAKYILLDRIQPYSGAREVNAL